MGGNLVSTPHSGIPARGSKGRRDAFLPDVRPRCWAASVVTALLAIGCATSSGPDGPIVLRWPEPPEIVRIEHVQVIRGPQDHGPELSQSDRFVHFSAGELREVPAHRASSRCRGLTGRQYPLRVGLRDGCAAHLRPGRRGRVVPGGREALRTSLRSRGRAEGQDLPRGAGRAPDSGAFLERYGDDLHKAGL